MLNSWLAAALATIALVCARPAAAQIGIVSVTGGRVEGIRADGVTSFKGIPFAAPPVGNLRWRAPQPVRAWSGIKNADHFAPGCMQPPIAVPIFGEPPAMSEDCLYLNVWTPAKSADARLPVMVWIYGGAFREGMTSQPVYDGAHLAQKGVVVVSLAYRLAVQVSSVPDSLIRFELWLPASGWNGKFLAVGNGGFAGSPRRNSRRRA